MEFMPEKKRFCHAKDREEPSRNAQALKEGYLAPPERIKGSHVGGRHRPVVRRPFRSAAAFELFAKYNNSMWGKVRINSCF
jgi:hypothetical protein